MASPLHTAYQTFVSEWFRNHGGEPGVAEQLDRHSKAALVLWNLDLEPARPYLAECYAPVRRGTEPWDPVVQLRVLLLSLLVEQTSINKWVDDLQGSRVLRVLAGIPEDKRRPGVGTVYDFLHRLHDGPPDRGVLPENRPSVVERRRSRIARPRKKKDKTAAPNSGRARRTARRADARRAAKEAAHQTQARNETATARLVEELQAARDLPAPTDLTQRLAEILVAVAVDESARRGLLGKLSGLSVNGDGSLFRTGASPHGKRACGHSWNDRCDCERFFSDPDAEWGWSHHIKNWVFGHLLYEVGVSVRGHDLPLLVTLQPGNGSDYLASLHSVDRLSKLLRERYPDWTLARFTADAGHDADATHRFLLGLGITPIIPARSTLPVEYPGRPDLKLSKRGVPLCPANVEMALRSKEADGKLVLYCPVRAGLLKACPLAPGGDPAWRCRPDNNWAPTVSLNAFDHPRICGPLPRNSPLWLKEYKARSGCERRNSVKKGPLKLVEAKHRRASFWLIRLNLCAILQHANAWIADVSVRAFVDTLLRRNKEVLPIAA